jgi:hypothetical protein
MQLMPERAGFRLGQNDNLSRAVGEALKHDAEHAT